MKIVVLDGHTENPGDLSWAELEKLGNVTVYDFSEPAEACARMINAEIVLTNKTVISREMIEQSTRLRMIGVLATGFNVVDIDAAAERCIPVCNVPSYATEAVAQYTFALLLELCHRVGAHDRAVQEGRWTQGKEFCFWDYPQIELNGKTMGLIGYGRIGQAVGRIAAAFGMKVLHFSPSGREGGDSLEEVLRQSDVLSLHCPLTAENHHLINAETLSMVKPGILLLNTARGSLIDEAALRKALLNGQVAGAAVDVAEREPIPADSPLLGLNNCLITPHIAWAAREARQRLMDTVVENVRAFQQGKPVNVVNGVSLSR